MSDIFMAKPTYFDVIHKDLNNHMKMDTPVNKTLSNVQYENLVNILKSVSANIKFIAAVPNLVDMVFAANGALIHRPSKTAVVSSFAAKPRQKESVYWKQFLKNENYNVFMLKSYFEGQGDALFSHNYTKLWMGYGFRTQVAASNELQACLPETKVMSLKLINPDFYHLDTCFCVLNQQTVMYYPDAFDTKSKNLIETQFTNKIIVSEDDAKNFGCNAAQIGSNIILHKASNNLKQSLHKHGYNIIENNMSEFLLSGGSVKCCILHA